MLLLLLSLSLVLRLVMATVVVFRLSFPSLIFLSLLSLFPFSNSYLLLLFSILLKLFPDLSCRCHPIAFSVFFFALSSIVWASALVMCLDIYFVDDIFQIVPTCTTPQSKTFIFAYVVWQYKCEYIINKLHN